jgi:hypothetical protein
MPPFVLLWICLASNVSSPEGKALASSALDKTPELLGNIASLKLVQPREL